MTTHLIWSEEHGRWWRSGGCGYTDRIAQAGLYSAEHAAHIVAGANYPPGTFHEIAIPVPPGLGELVNAHPNPAALAHAMELQALVNMELGKLPGHATRGEIEAVIERFMPPGWEWVDATSVGGSPSIALTRFSAKAPGEASSSPNSERTENED